MHLEFSPGETVAFRVAGGDDGWKNALLRDDLFKGRPYETKPFDYSGSLGWFGAAPELVDSPDGPMAGTDRSVCAAAGMFGDYDQRACPLQGQQGEVVLLEPGEPVEVPPEVRCGR